MTIEKRLLDSSQKQNPLVRKSYHLMVWRSPSNTAVALQNIFEEWEERASCLLPWYGGTQLNDFCFKSAEEHLNCSLVTLW